MAQARTGHQVTYRRTTKTDRSELGRRYPHPAVINPPDHSKDKRNPAWAREAAARVLESKRQRDAIDEKSYAECYALRSGGCEMEAPSPSRDILAVSADDQLSYLECYTLRSGGCLVEENHNGTSAVKTKTAEIFPGDEIMRRAPGKPPTLATSRMIEQIGGTAVTCPGCGKDLEPIFKAAAANGQCPHVFVWSENDKAYCGACFGKLPHPGKATTAGVPPRVNVFQKIEMGK